MGLAPDVKPPIEETDEWARASDMHEPTQQINFRLRVSTFDAVRQRAADTGLSISAYCREVFERDVVPDADEKFIAQFRHWWGLRGQGDPQQIVGAKFRAEGAGMTFAFKLRMMFKQMLDHGLI